MIVDYKLTVDNYPSRKALGYLSTADHSRKYAQKGLEAAQKATGFYASSGDRLSKFQNYSISDLAAETTYNKQKELVLAYKPGPIINFEA